MHSGAAHHQAGLRARAPPCRRPAPTLRLPLALASNCKRPPPLAFHLVFFFFSPVFTTRAWAAVCTTAPSDVQFRSTWHKALDTGCWAHTLTKTEYSSLHAAHDACEALGAHGLARA